MSIRHTYTDKAQENKSNAAANNLSKSQAARESIFRITDNRPEAIAQRKIQASVAQLVRINKKIMTRNVTFDPALLDINETQDFYVIRQLHKDEPHLSIPKNKAPWHVTFGRGDKVHFNDAGIAVANIGLTTAEIGTATIFFSSVTGLKADCAELLTKIQEDGEKAARALKEADIRTRVAAEFKRAGLNISTFSIDRILKKALGEIRMPNEDELSAIIEEQKNPAKPKNQKRGIEESQEVNNPNNKVVNDPNNLVVDIAKEEEQKEKPSAEKESQSKKKAKVED